MSNLFGLVDGPIEFKVQNFGYNSSFLQPTKVELKLYW